MSAGTALQTSIVARLQALAVTGIYDGAPARATYPYIVVDGGNESDWGTKSCAGREVYLAVTVWDDQPARLQQLSDEVEEAVATVETGAPWSLVNLRFSRRRTLRDVAGPWAVALSYRARLLTISQGANE